MGRRIAYLLCLPALAAAAAPASAQFQSCVYCDVQPFTPDPFDVTDCDTGTMLLTGIGYRDTRVNGCSARPTVEVRSTRPDRVVILAFRVLGDGSIEFDYEVPCTASEGLVGIDVTIDDDPSDSIIPYACGNARMRVHGMCGNGVLQSGEDCDDGNTVGGDGCDPNCRIETILAVTWADVSATALPAGGTRIAWRTALETDTSHFVVQGRDAAGTEATLPGWVDATGAGSSYRMVDDSPAAAGRVAYRVVEMTSSGAGDATPWVDVKRAVPRAPRAVRTRTTPTVPPARTD